MSMPVTVRDIANCAVVMKVLMVVVLGMSMLVFERLMTMIMCVPLAKMQPDTARH